MLTVSFNFQAGNLCRLEQ